MNDEDEIELERQMGVRRKCASCNGSGMIGRRASGELVQAPNYGHEIVFEKCGWCGGRGHVDPEFPLAGNTFEWAQ